MSLDPRPPAAPTALLVQGTCGVGSPVSGSSVIPARPAGAPKRERPKPLTAALKMLPSRDGAGVGVQRQGRAVCLSGYLAVQPLGSLHTLGADGQGVLGVPRGARGGSCRRDEG